MKNLLYTLQAAILVFFVACATDKKENPILKEAGTIHNEAHEMGEGVEAQFTAVDSLSALLAAKKMPAADSLVASMAAVKQSFEAWEGNIVTVPGMKHNHDHAEGDKAHAHDEHKPAPDVTPEQMLDIQKEMKLSIKKIKSDLETARAAAAALLK